MDHLLVGRRSAALKTEAAVGREVYMAEGPSVEQGKSEDL